ncbi:hypothetical protein ACHWQZ_G006382 [Mnemiopsis leidyi]
MGYKSFKPIKGEVLGSAYTSHFSICLTKMKYSLTLVLIFALLLISDAEEQKKRRKNGKTKSGKKFVLFNSESEEGQEAEFEEIVKRDSSVRDTNKENPHTLW